MRHRLKFVSLFSFLAVAASSNVIASTVDTLYLKDGSKRIGSIEAQDSVSTRIQTSTDLLVIAAEDILRTAREKPRDVLIPSMSFYLNGGVALPSQFDFDASGGFRVGGRYMFSEMFGINVSVTYASWQLGFLDTLGFKSATPQSETFTITAASPRIGAIVVTPIGSKTRLLLGVDVGETIFSAVSTAEGSPDTQTTLTYAFRFDFRFTLSDHLGLMAGVQFENFSTTFANMERHDLTTGATRHVGDMLISAGVDYGF